MAIQGFCPPPSHSHSPSPSHSPSHSHSPYYQLLERGSARLGRVKNVKICQKPVIFGTITLVETFSKTFDYRNLDI